MEELKNMWKFLVKDKFLYWKLSGDLNTFVLLTMVIWNMYLYDTAEPLSAYSYLSFFFFGKSKL